MSQRGSDIGAAQFRIAAQKAVPGFALHRLLQQRGQGDVRPLDYRLAGANARGSISIWLLTPRNLDPPPESDKRYTPLWATQRSWPQLR